MKGEAAEALAEWRRVLAAAPDHVAVLEQIARLLATSPEPSLRNGAEAVALAERAAELTGGRQPQILDTLAAAYAEAGRFAEALETARRALALAEASGNAALAGTLQTRLALYASGKPLREAGRLLAPR
jgi:tetratricopeptide (TPR) repeat protein